MTNLKRRITELEKHAPDYGELTNVDHIVCYLEHHRRGNSGRDERVPLATWQRLEKIQLERVGV